MNDNSLLNLASKMNNDLFVGVVGSIRSGKSTFIQSFFRLMVLPNITDEFISHKIIDELPQTSPGKQIMTVEPKFIPSVNLKLNIDDTLINLRFIDCVGEVIPSAIGYGTDLEPRLVKTPWFDEAISFKEAAQIGTEKVIFNHSNLGIYVTSDGSFSEFSRTEYEIVENNLIPKIKELNKPFVIILNTQDPLDKKAIELKNKLEEKWQTSVIAVSAIHLTKDDCKLILSKALEEFPITNLTINLPSYFEEIDDSIEDKININNIINDGINKFKRIKEVNKFIELLKSSNLFKNVTLNLLDIIDGNVDIDLELDDSLFNNAIKNLLPNINSKLDLLKYLNKSNKLMNIYNEIDDTLEKCIETGYAISLPKINEMELQEPTLAKKNGLYGVKLSAKSKCIHMISVDINSSFTPIIGSIDQAKMMINSMNNEAIWNQEFFGKKFSDIVNEEMIAKINNFNDSSKEKLKNVLTKVMNSDKSNIIAIIL